MVTRCCGVVDGWKNEGETLVGLYEVESFKEEEGGAGRDAGRIVRGREMRRKTVSNFEV